ncbi:hypothetical protein MFIFM68171_03608 [Madurella fahalii]|uniref:Rhodanese domain-containing protein n=1 Tax=Madurella fahalii TaxID=1157608 RepID=A0ABQ0G6K3_9PEZI
MSSTPALIGRALRSLNVTQSAMMSSYQPSEPSEPTTTAAPTPPWYAAYPGPRSSEPKCITREEVLAMLKTQLTDKTPKSARDFVLVDLRRTDHQGGTIRGSINLPAQSLHPTIPTLYSVLRASSVRKIIWYCSSSRGRGTRAAGWFADYISDQGDSEMQSLVLVGGIKGWATAGPEYTQWMDEYDEPVWLKE